MADSKVGYIHSIESFGTVDGPGIRYVVFFQGCPFRCLYCHNPDTWKFSGGTEMSVDAVLEGYERNREFYKNGGLTATGGEPLMQLDFLTELFRKARERGIHTCLDTSGASYAESKREVYAFLLRFVDLVLMDFKHSQREGHIRLTGAPPDGPWAFARQVEAAKVPMIVRHVLVPGITDIPEQLRELGVLMAGYGNVVGLDVLPYHTMGVSKYRELGLAYPLEGVPSLTPQEAKWARGVILSAFREERKRLRGSGHETGST